jgi:6-pyruvoyltetrahydropterin/6-carboxytetrahydropterin synthase
MKIHTKKHFDAAHYLKNYEGKCKNLHGHRWEVEVWIEGDELDTAGMLWDFTNLKNMVSKLDHKCLNDELNFNPTVENLVTFFYGVIKKGNPDLKVKVRVYETPESWAEVER